MRSFFEEKIAEFQLYFVKAFFACFINKTDTNDLI